jgi:hypothetical protein
LDYLLKRFKPTRFAEAVQRARELIANKRAGVAARRLLALLPSVQINCRFSRNRIDCVTEGSRRLTKRERLIIASGVARQHALSSAIERLKNFQPVPSYPGEELKWYEEI